jgi:hypothetical protein
MSKLVNIILSWFLVVGFSCKTKIAQREIPKDCFSKNDIIGNVSLEELQYSSKEDYISFLDHTDKVKFISSVKENKVIMVCEDTTIVIASNYEKSNDGKSFEIFKVLKLRNVTRNNILYFLETGSRNYFYEPLYVIVLWSKDTFLQEWIVPYQEINHSIFLSKFGMVCINGISATNQFDEDGIYVSDITSLEVQRFNRVVDSIRIQKKHSFTFIDSCSLLRILN